MADNITLNAGSGGSILAADDIGSVFFPRTKIAIGANGVNDGDVSAANPLPVTATAGDAEATIGTTPVVRVAAFDAADGQITNMGGPATSGGLSIFRSLDLDETEEEVKATAGQLYWFHAVNLTASVRCLKFYNATAANVTVGTTAPVATFVLPTNGDTNGCVTIVNIPHGLAFGTAICAAVTTALADADTGAPGANDVVINIGYK